MFTLKINKGSTFTVLKILILLDKNFGLQQFVI